MNWSPHFAAKETRPRARAATLVGLICIVAGGLQTAVAWRCGLAGTNASLWLEACALTARKLNEGRWWHLLVFGLAHGGFWHWAAGSVGFYITARSVEPILGAAHLLSVAALGTLAGGAFHCIAPRLGLLSPGQPLVGMLPAFFTLLGVYGTILPGWRIGAALQWRWARWCGARLRAPRARHAAWAAAGGAALWWGALGLGADWHPECGPWALLPALFTGWAYTRMLGFGDWFFFQRLVEERNLRERRMEQMNWEEFLNAELNPVLEKIARHGLRSLNAAERRILRHSRRKLEGW